MYLSLTLQAKTYPNIRRGGETETDHHLRSPFPHVVVFAVIIKTDMFFLFFFSFSAAVCISNIRHLSAHSSGRVTLNLTQAVEHSVVEELSFKKVF